VRNLLKPASFSASTGAVIEGVLFNRFQVLSSLA